MTEPELRPCPFCGGKARAVNKMSGRWVECTQCPASIYQDGHSPDMEETIARWNQRFEPQQLLPKDLG